MSFSGRDYSQREEPKEYWAHDLGAHLVKAGGKEHKGTIREQRGKKEHHRQVASLLSSRSGLAEGPWD